MRAARDRPGPAKGNAGAERDWSLREDVEFLEWLARVGRAQARRPPRAGIHVVHFCGRCGEQRTSAVPWVEAPRCCGVPMIARPGLPAEPEIWP